ncbi:neuronal acetylcholine receptor subunit alpha-2-like [Brachionus plicatilis]|uniref:Neuronal acetylcholine receptor subunit alpha-2-like n=1 Tax=Brachionus plicatilis TaxID=10195 RepID=A0A3M7PH35_BRAPC|nr:neuronal acetylcholine receptor subunit alpha-2-like [Brachionus plicatilis]
MNVCFIVFLMECLIIRIAFRIFTNAKAIKIICFYLNNFSNTEDEIISETNININLVFRLLTQFSPVEQLFNNWQMDQITISILKSVSRDSSILNNRQNLINETLNRSYFKIKRKHNTFESIMIKFLIKSEITPLSTGLEKLIDKIFKVNHYNLLVRPVEKESGLTFVATELKVLQIDLDEKYQELLSTVWIEMTWTDSRLSWDPKMFDNITEITLPISQIWVPDIVLQIA